MNVNGASKYNLWYFNCIIDIPSHPQLFLGGKVSIILLYNSVFIYILECKNVIIHYI